MLNKDPNAQKLYEFLKEKGKMLISEKEWYKAFAFCEAHNDDYRIKPLPNVKLIDENFDNAIKEILHE